MSNSRFNHPFGSHFWQATTIIATATKYAKSTNIRNAVAPSQLSKVTS